MTIIKNIFNQKNNIFIYLTVFTLLCSMFTGCKSKKVVSDIESSVTDNESTVDENISDDNMLNSSEKANKTSKDKVSDNSNSSKRESAVSNSSKKDITSSNKVQADSPKNPTLKEEKEIIMKANFSVVSPSMHQTVVIANDTVYEWSKNYTVKSSSVYWGSGNIYKPVDIRFEWNCDKKSQVYVYSVKISTDKNLKNADEYVTATNNCSIENLQAGKTYYWQVVAEFENGIAKSDIFTFNTEQTVRTVNIEGVSNTRDIGGYLTESGKRVKQGMVYRAATLNGTSYDGMLTVFNYLKIKTDLDLRKEGEGSAGSTSPLGLNYIHVSGVYYANGGKSGIANPNNWDRVVKEIEPFANKENYPIIMHCSIGRDRTGTLSMLINGLLGVSKKDLTYDYELSFFSEIGCREPDNIAKDMVDQFEEMLAYIETFGENGDSFASCVEKYMIHIGVSKEKINTIKNILLE